MGLLDLLKTAKDLLTGNEKYEGYRSSGNNGMILNEIERNNF